MSSVAIQTFQAPMIGAPNETNVLNSATVAALQAQVNSFLATIDPCNILDVQVGLFPAGKSGIGVVFQTVVIYLTG